jgi:hypothetical protein
MDEMSDRRRKHPPIVRDIAAAAFCDNGAEIEIDAIAAALDLDRSTGHLDPSSEEVSLLVSGDADGKVPVLLVAEHPALSALLEEYMT